MADKDLKK